MNTREGHISKIMGLSIDDLETYVRDKKPEWEFATTELKERQRQEKLRRATK